MGYYMYQKGSSFKILKENFIPALEAIKMEVRGADLIGIAPGDLLEVLDYNTLQEAMEEVFSWEVPEDGYDTDGNIVAINFIGEKAWDEYDYLFCPIAPFVEKDSYIELQGEDGQLWRWVFKCGKCHEIVANVLWGDVICP